MTTLKPRDRWKRATAGAPSKLLRVPSSRRVVPAARGDAALNVEPLPDAEENWEAACSGGCGYLVCSKRGPCAPPIPAKPSPSVSERVFAVGQRVRVTGDKGIPHCREPGAEGVVRVLDPSDDSCNVFFADMGLHGGDLWVSWRDLEPLTPDQPVAPVVGGAPLKANDRARFKFSRHGAYDPDDVVEIVEISGADCRIKGYADQSLCGWIALDRLERCATVKP